MELSALTTVSASMTDAIQAFTLRAVTQYLFRRSCISVFFAGCLCTIACGQDVPEPADHGIPLSVSYVAAPTGTFFPQDSGTLLYFEGVDVFSGAGSAIQNGIISTLYNMGASFAVMSLIATLPVTGPGAIVAMTMTALWKYRIPLSWWRSYRIALEGVWNYQHRRVGNMPVYFSSHRLQRRLIVNWRFPYSDERPVQLDIVVVPQLDSGEAETGTVAEQEQGWLAMARSLKEKELVRFVISIGQEQFVVSAQHQSGQWFHRTLSRPEQPLVVEQLVEWGKRKEINDGFTLLSTSSLNYLTRALECQAFDVPPWAAGFSPDRKLSEGEEGSLWELGTDISSTTDNRVNAECGFLGIVDNSTRYGGLAGYMHLNTQGCGKQDALFDRYNTGGFENELIQNNYIQVVPYWLTTLVLRIVEEGVSIGVRTAATPYMPAVENDSATPEQNLSDWLASAESQWIRGITLGKPDVESQPAQGKVFCRWLRGSGITGNLGKAVSK
ncbi:hypothetical protein [Sansalvadorimonas verongulae]|uniref:hypothetical protein n=1 Tax=Sansalvadorimonas verongulae TaxID=2172824 RepID=UPI0012BD206C|nr:hypothetical protein [Sansalvadorimonas verongulae]MTI15362.1 hypothetical protein [Sansalvadorimonas verongulae]